MPGCKCGAFDVTAAGLAQMGAAERAEFLKNRANCRTCALDRTYSPRLQVPLGDER